MAFAPGESRRDPLVHSKKTDGSSGTPDDYGRERHFWIPRDQLINLDERYENKRFNSPELFPSGTIPQAPEGIGLEFCILKCPECRI
eukprot:COSAG02_NODE_53062_length_304_cov_0.726829_1_plen_86_part_01